MNKIIYLDAAATALKPAAVIEAERDFLQNRYANAGRGICVRAAAVDDMVARMRATVADFIGAAPQQIVFTSGATDGLNRVVGIMRNTPGAWGPGCVVAVSDLEHHSARMPWAAAAGRGECEIKIIPLDCEFNLDVSSVPAADVVVVTAMSNVLGRAQDVGAIVRAARAQNPNVIVVVDAAQYVAHRPIDVVAWDADFVCFSGHKIGADTGVGIMYVKDPDRWSPDRFGGGMVNRIVGDEWIFNAAPERFEAGTLPLTQIAGLGAAIKEFGANKSVPDIMRSMHDALSGLKRVKIYTAPGASVLTFSVDGMHALDLGARVGVRGLCMRVGNMCATWTMNAIGAPEGGVARLSAGAWNTMDDAAAAVDIIRGVI